jgi:hypothetical protein
MTARFMTVNRVEAQQSITVSSGDASKANIYDRNQDTKWLSVGSNDTTAETVEIVFVSAVSIDRLSILNHNLKDFNVQYWNGAAYADFSTPVVETANIAANSFYQFNSVSTTKIKLTATKTIVANAQKYVGELLAYLEHFNLTDDYLPDNEATANYYRQFEHEKTNGGSVVVIEATKSKYQNRLTFNTIPKTYRDYIIALKNIHQSFWYIPDDSIPSEQYYCNMIGFRFDKIAAWTSTGERCYAGQMEIKET